MIDLIIKKLSAFGVNVDLSIAIALVTILFLITLIAWISHFVIKRYVSRLFKLMVQRTNSIWGKAFLNHRLFYWLGLLAPALVLYLMIPLISSASIPFSITLIKFVRALASVYFIFIIAMLLHEFLHCVDEVYGQYPISRLRPIRTYLQVIRILLFGVAAILAISVLINKSPVALLTGLGAMTAILLLVFKDSILGFVTSVQLTSYDMVRIGDWIEMPTYGADGDVIDISLNTIKVQNFDKTIVTIPTHILMTSGVKNWRGMQESGGRRIKRAVNIDMNSIQFCDARMIEKFGKIHYIAEYIDAKKQELQEHNVHMKVDTSTLVNGRHMTNIGTFRAYLEAYLRHHPDIHQNLTLLVRQLQPTEKGLPIELYVFTNDTDWGRYEKIQADIFDHVLAIVPEFELKVFQNITSL